MKKADIPSDQVERMASVGCSNVEIAHVFQVSEACVRQRFSKILTKGRAHRKMKLREMLWQSAENGSVAMLIWLSKIELGWSEKSSVDVSGGVQVQAVSPETQRRILAVNERGNEILTGVLASIERQRPRPPLASITP